MMALVQGFFTGCNDTGKGRGSKRDRQGERQRRRKRLRIRRRRRGRKRRRRRKNAAKICNTGIQTSSLFLFRVCILHA
jgi:hypothetical protein